MAIDFPDSPSTNDTYTVNGRTYIWNGEKWLRAQPELTSVVPTLTVSNDFTVDTDTLHVDSTNNRVGIGTTSPASSLEVHTDFPKITLTNDDQLVSADAYFAGIEMRDSSENLAGAVGFISGEDQDMRITSYRTGADLHLVTGGANNTRVTVTDTGNVGIGTTSPSTDLHVSNTNPTVTLQATANGNSPLLSLEGKRGTTGTATKVEFNARQTGALDINVDPDDSDADADSYFKVAVDGADAFHIDSEGRVGIGTTSPSELLDIDAGTAGSVELTTTGGRTIQLTANDSEPFLSVGSTTAHSAAIMTNGVRRLTIDSGGDVGIGVTSITNQFEVYNGTYYSIIGRKDWGLRSTGTYALSTSNGANVYISSNGTFYRSTSSGKYKTDVEDMNTDAADVVFALRPVWFRSTSPLDPEGWSYYGLIAEEVAEIDPRLVSFGAKEDCGCDFDADHVAECLAEPEGVYYDRLVPHLISVVQRQQEQIDALTARIEALEAG